MKLLQGLTDDATENPNFPIPHKDHIIFLLP